MFVRTMSLAALLVTGCTRVMTGEFSIRGHDVDSIVGSAGSKSVVETGKTNVETVRRKLGNPLIRYENNATDIFDAAPRYRWILNFWPVYLTGQAGPQNPHTLLRIDYDEHGVVRQHSTTTTLGAPRPDELPYFARRVWPDLSDRAIAPSASK